MRLSDEIRESLYTIAEENNGYLTPEKVVEAAQAEDSPLHHRFEWDDSEAARKFRNIQAGVLIRQIKVTVIKRTTTTKEINVIATRALQAPMGDRGKGGYSKIEDIMADPARREDMLRTVLTELAAYRKRYANLEELANVWEALDKLLK